MSRPLLALYRLDRDKLHEMSEQLRALLAKDDREGLAKLLGLGEELARRVAAERWAVALVLRPDDDAHVAPIFASLRRVAKRAALEETECRF